MYLSCKIYNGKVLAHLGCTSKVESIAHLPMWDSAPHTHSRVSNVNFDIGGRGSINISCKIPKAKVLAHLGSKSKGSLPQLTAWV